MIEIIHHFGDFDGSSPTSQLVRGGSWLYGTTTINPTLFKTDLRGNKYTVIQRLNNADPPVGKLIVDDEYIYGMTLKTLFRLRVGNLAYETLALLTAKTVAITISNGTVYGVTEDGGEYEKGTIFKCTNGTITTLVSFSSEIGKHPIDLIHTPHGIVGITSECGGLFRYDPILNNTEILHRFGPISPNTGVVYSNGILYGTTNRGGDYNKGTIYQYNFIDSSFIQLYSFGRTNDGYYPQTGPTLIDDSILVGTTLFGGRARMGMIYRFNMENRVYSSLYDFSSSNKDAAVPYGSLLCIEGSCPYLFGTTKCGGNNDAGILFRILLPRWPTFFIKGTCILTQNSWVRVEDLRLGDMVKTYKHGLRRIIHISKWGGKNESVVWHKALYKGQREGFEPLIVAGCHGLIEESMTKQEEQRQTVYWGPDKHRVDDMALLITAASKDFYRVQAIISYTYYMFALDSQYGIYANGFLVEIPAKDPSMV